MAYRVFIALIVLTCLYFAVETVRLKTMQHSLLYAGSEHSLGNPDGDITLVQFLDYSCVFCRDAHPILTQAIQKDGHVRFIPRPVSVLGAEGMNAAFLPYAAAKQGKFSEMHEALISNYRVIDDQVLQDLCLEIGIDHQQLKIDLEDKDVLKAVEKNLGLYNGYRLTHTPAYALGKKILFIPGRDLSVNDFLTLFEEARGQ